MSLQYRAWSTVMTVYCWSKCEDIAMHLFTTVFSVSNSCAGARIMGKYPAAVCSGSSDETD